MGSWLGYRCRSVGTSNEDAFSSIVEAEAVGAVVGVEQVEGGTEEPVFDDVNFTVDVDAHEVIVFTIINVIGDAGTNGTESRVAVGGTGGVGDRTRGFRHRPKRCQRWQRRGRCRCRRYRGCSRASNRGLGYRKRCR